MKVLLAIAAVMMTAFLPAQKASAEASIRIGTLECNVASNVGFIVGSKAGLSCLFKRANGTVEDYEGSITKIGIDVGFTSGSKLIWVVLAPSSQIAPGALDGRYYGVTAEATAAVGVGANVLIGGFDSSINLQPLSVQVDGKDEQVGNRGLRGIARLLFLALDGHCTQCSNIV